VVLRVVLHQRQVEAAVLAQAYLRLVKWHDLFFDHDVELQFTVDDVVGDLADDFL